MDRIRASRPVRATQEMLSQIKMTEIPCKCGHSRELHPQNGKFPFIVCDGCFKRNRPNGFQQVNCKQECVNYIPDNLMFIEQLAKVRGLV